jgi:hypothetical protein
MARKKRITEYNYCKAHDELRLPTCPVCETGIKKATLKLLLQTCSDHEVISKLIDGKLQVQKVVFFAELQGYLSGSTEYISGRQPTVEWWPIDEEQEYWMSKPIRQRSRWWS